MSQVTRGRSRQHTTTTDQRFFFDVGSTTARVLHQGEVIWQEPSCIAVHRTRDEVLAVGAKAYQLLGKTTEQVRVLFPVQYGVVSDQHAYEQLLQAISLHFKNQLSLWEHFMGVAGCYSHLASFTPQEKTIVQKSLANVGLGRLKLCDQVLAAAATLQLLDRGGRSYCVIDIGGQVSEVAIITGQEVVAIKRLRWGGVQCTELIQEFIVQKYESAVSWHTAEQIKKEVGEVPSGSKTINHKLSVRGKNLLTQMGKTVVVSGEDLLPVCTQFADEIVSAVQLLFGQAPTEIVTSCLEQGIFLVGGGALMKGLPGYLQQKLAAEVSVAHDPDHAIVRGLQFVS